MSSISQGTAPCRAPRCSCTLSHPAVGRAEIRRAGISLVLCLVALVIRTPSYAVPAFARIHRLPCSACHSHVPQLNDFGRAFQQNSFRIPGQEKDAPLALRRTIPLGLELLGRVSSNSRAAEGEKWDKSFDALILQGGGLLTLKDAFYVHHHILEDNRPGDVYELWVQHAFDDRANLKLRMGQYEQPLGLSPEILRLTHSGYLSYEAGVGQNDFGLSSLVRGFMLSGGSIGDGLRFSLSFHAPQENEGAHGESDMPSDGGTGGAMQALHAGEDATLTRDLNTVFFRLEQQIRGKRFGLFATTGSVDIATADGTAKDHFSRYGIDFDLPLRSAHVYGTWLSGENSNPTVDGGRGSFNGGFIGAEVHIRARWKHDPRYAPFLAYLQYDRVHARSPMESTINEGPTVGLKIYPMQAWAIQLEYQHRRQNEDGVVLATHLAF